MRPQAAWLVFACIAGWVLAAPHPAAAVVPKDETSSLDALKRVDERLRPSMAVVPLEEAQNLLVPEARQAWESFLASIEHGDEWSSYVDTKTGRIAFAEGPGIPWIPGRGNDLGQDLTPSRQEIGLPDLERIARELLPRVAVALGIDPSSVVLNPGRSGRLDEGLWFVDFDLYREGTPVEKARVVFRVNGGNLIQIGTEALPTSDAPVPDARLSRQEALSRLSQHIGGLRNSDLFLDEGSLHLLPFEPQGPLPLQASASRRGLIRVWRFLFRRTGEAATWQAQIDATSGAVLEFQDVNRYAQVTGGVYPVSSFFADETVLPMPFADVSPSDYADSSGSHALATGAVSTLNGRYVQIQDNCGSISLAGDSAGNVSFGTGAGQDCDTAGFGGPGNTHSARTQFYHVNRAKEVGRTWLPANPWLDNPLGTPLVANVNIASTCNAYWNGDLNFFLSGGGCGNTGEIAAISLHEYGHGLDQNDGNGPSEGATGETYGDFTASLQTRVSCIGDGFSATPCAGYGDACVSCTGVRDIDWAKHASITPHTVSNFIQTNCAIPDYTGPCGLSAHCESYVPSEALWDFVARDLPSPGSDAAWLVTERLWYQSRPTATDAFTCNTAPSTWTSDGCGTGSLWHVLRAVDDDDGDPTNGTPNSCALFAAFDRHGIACATDPGASTCFTTCSPPATPVLTVTPGTGQVDLSWTSAGVGVVYDIYRSETGCASGFLKISDDLATLIHSDSSVIDGVSYSYQVVAHQTGQEACAAPPSTCQAVTLPAPTDVWSQDTTADTGTIPSPGDMWKSDDIWVNSLTSGGSHQDPELGSTNYMHVKVRNAGPSTAYGVHVRMYWADANIGLSWPQDWHPIGTASIPSLPAGTEAEAVLPWLPPATGHFCLLARIVAAQDPMTTVENADIDHNVRLNNNIVWKNVNVVDLVAFAATADAFTIANSGDLGGIFRLTLREVVKPRQASLLEWSQLILKLPENLFQRWSAAGRPGNGVRLLPDHYLRINSSLAYIDLPLESGEKLTPCIFFLLNPEAAGAPPTRFWFEVAMDRLGGDGELIPVGGIAWDLRVGGEPVDAFVSATKEVRGTFEEGGLITYTLTMHNSGADAQMDNPGDELRDPLPPEVEPLSVKASAGLVRLDGATVSWNGMIRPGKSVTVTIEGRLREGTQGRTVANQAKVFYDEDNNGTNEARANSDDPATPAVADATQFLVRNLPLPFEDQP